MRNIFIALVLAMACVFHFGNQVFANPGTPVIVDGKTFYMEKMISQYATSFDDNKKSRTKNIRVAIKKINGMVIMPKEIISFNDRVGPRNAAAGFVEAASYENGKVISSFGGGICQLASTWSGATIDLKLKVVERHRHSLPVNYVSPDNEATVAYGFKDFKFQNNTNNVLFLKAFIIKNKVYVEYWRCKSGKLSL